MFINYLDANTVYGLYVYDCRANSRIESNSIQNSTEFYQYVNEAGYRKLIMFFFI